MKRVPEFKDYVVLSEEGSGGYGTVYKVYRKKDGQIFAIKCPLEKTTHEYVNHEIEMLQRVGGKEYIVRCEDVVHEVQFTKLEVDAKENLRSSLVLCFIAHDKPEVLRKEITIQELQLYGYCLFRALGYLHKQGIVHRDVKPGNFLFSRTRGSGYLVDFNLALVVPMSSESAKSRRPSSTPLKDPLKVDVIKCSKVTSFEKILGKRVQKDEVVKNISKRLQSSPNLWKHEVECIVPNKQHLDNLSRSNGAIPLLHKEDISKIPIAFNSNSKAMVIHDPTIQPQKLHQRQRSSKHVRLMKELDGGVVAQSTSDKSTRVPKTIGVHHFSHCLRSQSQTQDDTTSGVPLASKHKRVSAIHHKNRINILQKMSPLRPAIEGVEVRRNLPKDGPCAGTKGYRAPEVLLKSNLQTTKLDIWSAGVSLLQLIVGKTPFPSSNSETALKDIAKLRGVDDLLKLAGAHDCLQKLPLGFDTSNYKPSTIMDWCNTHARRREIRDMLPHDLCDLLERCLQVDPTTRIEASEALRHDFFNSIPDMIAHNLENIIANTILN